MLLTGNFQRIEKSFKSSHYFTKFNTLRLDFYRGNCPPGSWILVSVEPWLYKRREDLHNEHQLDMDTREIFQLAF